MAVKTGKITITRRASWRYEGIGAAAKALGVTETAVRMAITGRPYSLSKAKRERLRIVDAK
mgnify:CR=1 FL=1